MRILKPIYTHLFLIVLLGVVLRFWHLGVNPVGFHRDEAFLAYNAYSILKTGKDMSGNAFPIHLQSFFWSPAGYSYASIPFIWAFGLSEFSAQFASALFGSLAIIATFFFARLLLTFEINLKEKTQKIADELRRADTIALLSSLVLSISPWHINASRIGIEITLVVFLLICGALSFLLFVKSHRTTSLIVSFFLFALTFTVYQAPRAFVPFILPILVLLYRRHISKKQRILSGILYVLCIVLPLILIIKSPILSLRIQSLSVFKSPHAQLKIDEAIREDGGKNTNSKVVRLLHNKVVGYGNEIINNYVSHFSFDFLFRDKAFPTRMTIFGAGNMHLVELLFLLFGMYMIVTRRSRYHILIGLWILLAPIGSSMTYDDVPNMQRTLLMQPALGITVAFGIYALLSKVRSHKMVILPVIGLAALYLFNMLQYLDAYYVHQPIQSAQFRNAGYSELVSEVVKMKANFKRIVITNAESAPSVFFLFYTAYDPISYQRESVSADKNKSDSIYFSTYEFESDDCPLNSRLGFKKAVPYTPKPLSVSDRESLFIQFRGCPVATESAQLLHTVYQPNGQEIFQIIKPL